MACEVECSGCGALCSGDETMIQINWCIVQEASGGSFSVPDGTNKAQIDELVAEKVKQSVYSTWAVKVSPPKDDTSA